jgi:ribosomal protein S18 acetylase RimI-like enzyme
MNTGIVYKTQTASVNDVGSHLKKCDKDFIPPLHEKVNIEEYAHKINKNAITFEAWENNELTGLIAIYCNDHETKTGFITNVSVIKESAGNGIAYELMKNCITYLKEIKFNGISLEVNGNNLPAIKLYEKFNFILKERKGNSLILQLNLTK